MHDDYSYQSSGETQAVREHDSKRSISRPFARGISLMAPGDPGQLTADRTGVIGEDRSRATIEGELVALMNRYEAPIYAYLMSIVHNRDVALDCAQDTFVRAFHALEKGKVITGSWLYTVAHNRAVDEFRRQRPVERDDGSLDEVPARDASNEHALDVRAIMDRLSPADREVLYLFEIAGFTTDEIGAMLGTRGSAIRQRLTRARQRFRALYSFQPDVPTRSGVRRKVESEPKTGT